MVSKERKKELTKLNAAIYKRYCNLSETQPLASEFKIFSTLALEFDLTTNMIYLIVRTAQQNNAKQ